MSFPFNYSMVFDSFPYIFSGAILFSSALLDQLSVASTASYSLRKLRSAYTGNAIRVRRSSDNAEQDIGFATAPQTRTNLASIPVNNDGGTTSSGLTMTTLGTGTEFGQPYIDVRLQGTATVAGFPQFQHSPSGTFNPTIHAPITDGLVYTASLGARLIAGTSPAGGFGFRALCRTTAGTVSVGPQLNSVPAPTSALQRYAVSFVSSGGSAYCQVNLFATVALLEVVDFTLRLYSANVEQGIGNLRPLLQRNTPEVVAGVGDLDVEKMAGFVGGENLLLQSEEFANAVWGKLGGVIVTGNNATAPNGTTTADTMTGTAITPQLILNQAVTRTINVGETCTISMWVRNATSNLVLRIARSGAGTYEEASIPVPVSSEWQRISVSRTFVNAQTGVRFDMVMSGGTANLSLEMWGSQLNIGTTATPYNATTTTAIPLTASYNGFVTTWYDQSGNARNATQTTAGNQPSLVSNGACSSNAGHPSVPFNGTTTFLNATLPLGMETTALFVALNTNQTLGGSTHKALLAGNGTSFLATGTTYGLSYSANTTVLGISLGNGTTEQRADISNTITNNLEIVGFMRTGNSTRIIRNGVLGTIGTQDRTTGFTSSYNIGADPSTTRYYTGGISEITLFTSALNTTNRFALESNQGSFYGITVSPPQTSATPTISGASTVVEGNPLSLSIASPIGGATYAWSASEGTLTPSGSTAVWTPAVTGTGRSATISCTSTEVGKLTSPAGTLGVSITVASSSLTLDALSASSSSAYSIRKLRTAYAGSAIRVRRSSDNLEADIGFSGTDLDTTALLAHCGAGNGFIVTAYDQSGNARNATQATAANQMQIVASGVVILQNTKPSLRCVGTTPLFLNAYKFASPSTAFTHNNVASIDNTTLAFKNLGSDGGGFAADGVYAANDGYLFNRSGAFVVASYPSNFTNATLTVGSATHTSGNVATAFKNGTAGTPTAPITWTTGSQSNWFIGRYFATPTTASLTGYVSEHITFDSVLTTTDRNLLERDQGTYFSITVA